jgi:cell division protein FtsL
MSPTIRPNKKVVMQATQIIHAYKQAPWRVQRQYVGAFLLAVIVLALVAALYLDLSARTALTGREIQELQIEITILQRSNADLVTELANLTASAVMQQRALELGYRPVKPGELDYVFVPGYVTPEPAILLAAVDETFHSNALPEEYSQSLLEWLDERVEPRRGMQ